MHMLQAVLAACLDWSIHAAHLLIEGWNAFYLPARPDLQVILQVCPNPCDKAYMRRSLWMQQTSLASHHRSKAPG